jgi:dephospho-CoA kinase
MTKVIFINGAPSSGKDILSEYLATKYDNCIYIKQ